MVAAAASARDKRRRSRAPEGGATPAIGNDDGEEHHPGASLSPCGLCDQTGPLKFMSPKIY